MCSAVAGWVRGLILKASLVPSVMIVVERDCLPRYAVACSAVWQVFGWSRAMNARRHLHGGFHLGNRMVLGCFFDRSRG